MDFEQREVRLRTGTCPSCAKEFAFVEGATVSSRLGTPPSGPATPSGEGVSASVGTEGGPECEECGSALSFREGKGGSIEAVCPDCETTTVFVPKREAARPERERERPERFEAGPPRGRPCRKCGAPLRFSTGDDGMLVGECEACGNRFTLPPRDDRPGGGRGDRSGPRFERREYRPRSGSRPPYQSRGGDRGGRPFRGSDRRGPPRFDDEDNRRKRRRRDD
jgi:DNA-directed RNA polymerase subunit M/transcription elongation factor TFIIS